MKKRILCLLLAACFALTPPCASAQAAGAANDIVSPYTDVLYAADEIARDPRILFEYVREEQALPPDLPAIGCEAAYVADPVSGKVFYEKNAHKKMYPASTTKLLTALVVLENCTMEETATVSQSAVDAVSWEYVNAGLQPGEELSVYLLLQTLLICSANEAAFVLAEHVSGSTEAFAELCNRRAKELGCETLHFVNPNGIHSEDHYCSAYDLYLIAKECRKHNVFNEIVKMTSVTVPPNDVCPRTDRIFETTNELLLPESEYYYAPCTGIKTGYTDFAGQCFVAGSTLGGLDLITVVLNGSILEDETNERFTDAIRLMDYVYGRYSYHMIADSSVPVARIHIDNATKDTAMLEAVLQADIYSAAPNGITPGNAAAAVELPEDLKAPIKKDQVLGTVTYKADGMNYTTNLVAKNAVEKKPYWLYNSLIALAGLLLNVTFLVKKRKSKPGAKNRTEE
ncbi:MAG: D-alanyl-D-alanine carboxypeptidase [Clostridia bacterium]|nr:D-alanyl-D-alanine carboxypeptidase [Clostridia bacterium]